MFTLMPSCFGGPPSPASHTTAVAAAMSISSSQDRNVFQEGSPVKVRRESRCFTCVSNAVDVWCSCSFAVRQQHPHLTQLQVRRRPGRQGDSGDNIDLAKPAMGAEGAIDVRLPNDLCRAEAGYPLGGITSELHRSCRAGQSTKMLSNAFLHCPGQERSLARGSFLHSYHPD